MFAVIEGGLFRAAPPIRKLEGPVRWICQAVRLGAVGWLLWVLASTAMALADRPEQMRVAALSFSLDPLTVTDVRYIGFCVFGALSALVDAFLIVAVWRLLAGFQTGDVLSVAAARRLSVVGRVGLLVTALERVFLVAAVWVLTGSLSWNDFVKLALDADGAMNLVLCAFLLALGSALSVVAEIAAENEEFV